jgi:hypothetical protein
MNSSCWQARWFAVDRELSLVESSEQRAAVWRVAWSSSRVSPRMAITLFGGVVLCLLFGLTIDFTLRRLRLYSAWTHSVAILIVVPIVTGLLPLIVHRRAFRRSVREQIRAIGIPLCLHCGYNLTGIDSERCPECGKPAERHSASPTARETK